MQINAHEKNMNILLLSMIVLFPWIFLVFQGLDILEFGYWVVSFENFFTHPEVMPDIVFGSWLTGFIGAVVDMIFGKLGVVGHRIAFVLSLYLLLYIIYLLLSPFTTKKHLLYFLLLSEVFVNINTYTLTNYYMLTILFYLLGLLSLYKGVISNKLSLLFLAGIILGLNFYIRIPNILGLSLIIVIVYYDLITGKFQFKQLLRKVCIFLAGFFVAIVGILFLMKMLGHYELFLQQMNYLFDLLFSNNQGYGAGSLKKKFIYLHYYALVAGLLLFTILFLILVSTKYWASSKYKQIILVISSTVLAFVLIRLSEADTAYYYGIYLGFIGLTYVSLLWIGYTKYKVDPKFSTLALATLLIFELVPLGSRAYKYQLVYGMYMVIPVVLIYLYSLKEVRFKNFMISENSIKTFLSLFTISIIIYSMIVSIYYRAPANEVKRWTMYYSVDHPKLKGIYLTKERADTLNELIPAMNKYAQNFTYIMTYEQISTVSYLSDLEPYLSNTYPFFLTPPEAKKIIDHAGSTKPLPLVVRASTDTLPISWPKNRESVHTADGKMNKVRVVIQDFLKENGYQVVWYNKDFEILIPAIKDK